MIDQKRGSNKSPEVGTQGGYGTAYGTNLTGNAMTVGGTFGNSNVCGAMGAMAAANSTAVASVYGLGGHSTRGIEGQIFNCVFKPLVTRFVKTLKEVKAQENISLYCDLRQFMAYVKEVHGGVFRRVILSGILDSADRPNKRYNSNVQTTRVIRYKCLPIRYFYITEDNLLREN